MKIVRCRGCKADIFFTKVRSGRSMPLNAGEVTTSDPRVHLFSDEGVWVKPDDNKMRRGYVSHFATCPQSKSFRKAKP